MLEQNRLIGYSWLDPLTGPLSFIQNTMRLYLVIQCCYQLWCLLGSSLSMS